MGMAARSGRGHGLVLLLVVAMFGAQRVAAVPSSLRTVPAELLGELGVLDAQSNDLHEALEILAALPDDAVSQYKDAMLSILSPDLAGYIRKIAASLESAKPNHAEGSLAPRVATTCFNRTAGGSTGSPVAFIGFGEWDPFGAYAGVPTPRLVLESGTPDFVMETSHSLPSVSQLRTATRDEDAAALLKQLRELSRKPVVNMSEVNLISDAPEYGAGSLLHMLIFPVLEAFVEKRTLFAPSLNLWAPKGCAARDLSCYFDSLPSLSDYAVDAKVGVLRRKDTMGGGGDGGGETDGGGAAEGAGEGNQGGEYDEHDDDDDQYDDDSSEDDDSVSTMSAPSKALGRKVHHLDMKDLLKVERYLGVKSKVEMEKLLAACNAPSAREMSCPQPQWLDVTCGRCGLKKLNLIGVRDKSGVGHHFDTYNEGPLFDKLEPRFKRHGRFWLISQILHFLTRPEPTLATHLAKARELLGLDSGKPYLSLHVRKGDACTARGDCRDIKSYMPQISEMVSKYGLQSIFLSTPSASVLEETKDFPQVHFVYMPVTPSGAAMKAHGVKQLEEGLGLGIVDAGLEFRAYMLDMYLLAEGSAFLGAFTSNAARLAYSLMSSGTEGCLKPYVSFDINWCYAMEKGGPGVVRKGAKSCREDAKCHAQRADTIGC